MGGVLFASDLDNTLLFSHRHRQDTDRCVEYLEGKVLPGIAAIADKQ